MPVLSATSTNVRILSKSNRRHYLPEYENCSFDAWQLLNIGHRIRNHGGLSLLQILIAKIRHEITLQRKILR